MSVAPFPTIARPVTRIRSEVWLAFAAPVARGELVSHDVPASGHVIDARDAIARPAELLDAWLALHELTCCTLQVGLQLYADGTLWTDGITDHFRHLGGWAALAESLLDGTPGSASVWEESTIRSRIDGEDAMIWDERVLRSGRARGAWLPIRAERVGLARAIADGGTIIDALRHKIVAELDRRFDRAALPARLDPSIEEPRARELHDKAAVIDREVARRFDTLAFRAIAARLSVT